MGENNWKSRWSKEQLHALLVEQFQSFWNRPTGIPRQQLVMIQQAASAPHAVIISGLRRVGKSTLLSQAAHWLGEDQFYYINFEDERFLGFEAEDINTLYSLLVELFGERRIFFMDEIQNIPDWERFVRRFIEMGFKFYITGSNASLLSQELGTHLTGRYLAIELFPFSFVEYLSFKGYVLPDLHRATTLERALLQRRLEEYMLEGGIPEPLQYPGLPLRRSLYDDVLYRDIATRYKIDEVTAFKELAYYLISNTASLVSYNRLKEMLHLGSVNTVKNYVDYLQTSWLIFAANVYDVSVKRQQIAPKKIYSIDTGLANSVGFAFSPNSGRLLENMVYLALRRRTHEVYYLTTPAGYEVDFYLPETSQLIQVAWDIDQPQTYEREVRALLDGMKATGQNSGLVLSGTNREKIEVEGKMVEFRSTAEWLVDRSSDPLPTLPQNQKA